MGSFLLQRVQLDEALARYNEQMIEVQCELQGIIEKKEVQIAKYIAGFAEMKKQLSAAQSSVDEVHNSANQVLCLIIDIIVVSKVLLWKGMRGVLPWLLDLFSDFFKDLFSLF